MAKKSAKLFSEFPQEIYIVSGPDEGDYWAYTDKKDAAEDAIETNSQVAVYVLDYSGKASVEYDVTIEGA